MNDKKLYGYLVVTNDKIGNEIKDILIKKALRQNHKFKSGTKNRVEIIFYKI